MLNFHGEYHVGQIITLSRHLLCTLGHESVSVFHQASSAAVYVR